jgi:hypothetical protein
MGLLKVVHQSVHMRSAGLAQTLLGRLSYTCNYNFEVMYILSASARKFFKLKSEHKRLDIKSKTNLLLLAQNG